MSATNQLAALNVFRANEGKAPITAWKKSRHESMLAAYEGKSFEAPKQEIEKQQVRPSVVETRTAAPVNPDAMRPINEELGADIKATRAAWRASGANVTKKEFALELMIAGTTIKGLVDKMGVTETAARSLVGDVRRMKGVTVTREGDVYFAAVPVEETEEEEDGE